MMTLSPLLVCMASLYERALLFYLTGGITIVYDNCVWVRMLLCVSTYVVVCEYVCCFDPAYNRIVSPILVTFSWSSMRSCTFNGM